MCCALPAHNPQHAPTIHNMPRCIIAQSVKVAARGAQGAAVGMCLTVGAAWKAAAATDDMPVIDV